MRRLDWLCLFLVTVACAAKEKEAADDASNQTSSEHYLGQPLPGLEPEIFAPGLVSLPDKRELNAVFSPDGSEFYFAREVNDAYKTFMMKRRAGVWSAPEITSFSASNEEWDEVDMWFAPDGETLYYISNAPAEGFAEGSVNIWRVERDGDDWGTPVVLPRPINSDATELYPIPTPGGAFYFASSRDGGYGERDVYVAQEKDGVFSEVTNLGSAINTDASESDAYVSPDERFMIVTSGRAVGLGGADMYFVERGKDGAWGEYVNLGAPINSEDHDYTPIITGDGCYFFFTRNGDIYWVGAGPVLAHMSSGAGEYCDSEHAD